ncbi:MAG: fibronectin-binding domain-containing protein [Methanobacteriota archaeon]|nr:MAG: fibronectin-binding domain-containing protein [Euryarchaeota archaeon]
MTLSLSRPVPFDASMKDGMSSFDVLAVVPELRTLVGGFVDKVYQREDEVILKVNVPGGGRRELYAKVGAWLCLREAAEKPESPPSFAMALRKHLDNARIAGIEQRGFDRIVTVSFDRGPRLIYELFGKGNLVLVQDETTAAAFRRATFRDRSVGPGRPYEFPPATANPLEMTAETFAGSASAAKGPIVKVLASAMNLGGQYAEEVCLRAGIEKSVRVPDSSDSRLAKVHEVIRELARQIRENPSPQVVFEGEAPVDVTPVPLVQYESRDQRSFPTFGEALSFFLDHHVEAPPAPSEDAAAKVRRRLEQQEASLRDLRAEEVQTAALAHFLYAHFPVFEDLIRAAREGTLKVGGTVLDVDHERHVARVAVADVTDVEIDWTKDVNQNAQRLFDRKKDLREKAEKVASAIEQTRRELERAAKEAGKVAARPKVKATKAFWFEAYRWFISSEEFLVIGGRDAKTNDAVVKKHLKEGDRYVHADVHGAPSCVVKDGSKAGEATLREACAFALAWSKAWSAGIASGSTFWVLPEQVSKRAESGEYVSRGAWVVRGKRNYVHDIPVRAAIGQIEHEGHHKVMAGPVEAVAPRASRYYILEPGDQSKEEFARECAREFEVPIEEATRVLPPGKVRVVRQVRGEGMTAGVRNL